jgi:glycosyltransferase involved in cell wall biosynthesis
MNSAEPPLFSVVIPTRNRSALFAVALQSVRDQRFANFEVIVVDDGSTDEDAARCRDLVAALPDARMITLVARERGHGQSYALNVGAVAARGEYLCFLDDDDEWIDPEHLARSGRAIAAGARRPDLVLANQRAFRNGTPVADNVWIEDLARRLPGKPDAAGAHAVTAAELLTCAGHCHLNTAIVSRAFYLALGGLDEGLRYECERDFYLRALDRAAVIKYLPDVVSRHNIPDPASRSSMSTTLSELEKRLFQLRLLDKAALFSVRPELRHYAMRQRGFVLKHIASEAARGDHWDVAACFARAGLAAKFNLGWLAVTMLYMLRRLRFGDRRGRTERMSDAVFR